MARSISVKVPTALLISQLETKLAEINEAIATYPQRRAEYEKALQQYHLDVARFATKFVSENLDKIGNEHDSLIRVSQGYGNKVDLSFDRQAIEGFPVKPEEPQRPNQERWFGREHATQKSLIEKNLKILKMTTQEEVNASTYGAVMEIL